MLCLSRALRPEAFALLMELLKHVQTRLTALEPFCPPSPLARSLQHEKELRDPDSSPDLKGSPPMARCGHYIISAMCSKRHRKAVKQQIRRVCLLSFCRCHSAIFFWRFFGGSTFACANCASQWLSLFGQTENRKKLGSSHDQKKMRLEIFISKII